MKDEEYDRLMAKAIDDIQYICEEAKDHGTSWTMFKYLIEESMKKNQMWFKLQKEF